MSLRRLLLLLLVPFLVIPGSSRLHFCLRALACAAAHESCGGDSQAASLESREGARTCCAESPAPETAPVSERDADDGVPCGCCVDLAPAHGDAAPACSSPVAPRADLLAPAAAALDLAPRPRAIAPSRLPPLRPPAIPTYSPLRI